MEFTLWSWLGGVCALIWVAMAVDAAARKTSLREWAADAAFGTAVLVGGITLLHLGVSWLTQTPLGWLLFFGFILAGLFVRAMVGALRLIVDLLSGR